LNLYCIKHGKPLAIAKQLIEKANDLIKSEAMAEQTIHTHILAEKVENDISESDLLDLISEHPHNFSLSNKTAKEVRQMLLNELTGSAEKPGIARREHDVSHMHYNDAVADKDDKDIFKGQDRTSVDFLLRTIKGMEFVNKKNDTNQSIRDIIPRKEIYNQFPDKQSLSMKDPSSYALRKDIILLYFYKYWANDYLSDKKTGNLDGFRDELNDVLFECGFSLLYVGNPYDWLFLYCASCATGDSTPIDLFRDLFYSEVE